MCPPRCLPTVQARLSRRGFFRGAGAAAAGGAAALALPARPAVAEQPRSFTRVVDLTHALGPDFPTFSGEPQIGFEDLMTFAENGFNTKRWMVVEHTGTHMDAPIHFAEDAETADEVPVQNLVAPLAVIDIAARAADDPDTRLTPDDIAAWEAANGPIPDGACVAMHSGWDAHVTSARFRNADADGTMHFPGVHPEAADMLMRDGRTVVGLAVDTLSLDHGPSADFATHYAWLPTNRWGVECAANLGALPAAGATIVMGGPKIKGATGGPSRVIALV